MDTILMIRIATEYSLTRPLVQLKISTHDHEMYCSFPSQFNDDVVRITNEEVAKLIDTINQRVTWEHINNV